LGIDRGWRRRAVKIIGETIKPRLILDVATGTGDLAIASLRLGPEKVTGIDISGKMLEAGREKIIKKGLENRIELIMGDSEKIMFPDNTFDVAMVAFGVRNFSSPAAGLREMLRVVRPGGMVMVLEFSKPSAFPFRNLYFLYFRRILPWLGKIFSKHRDAYSYLPDSVMNFPESVEFIRIMSESGFSGVTQKRVSAGIASIYTGIKP
jgi:demethylmenaquinone methyltransferase/2-methoxy-6-polyprenyl-1,4-benzoquinol methylase